MSKLVPSEIIEKLEERHERLIVELDELNERLEKTLNSFVKPAAGDDELSGQAHNSQLAACDSLTFAGDQGAPTC